METENVSMTFFQPKKAK